MHRNDVGRVGGAFIERSEMNSPGEIKTFIAVKRLDAGCLNPHLQKPQPCNPTFIDRD